MRKLVKHARTSGLMNIEIKWQGELIKYNLHEEMVIDPDKITHEALMQPSAYAFLAMLHKKLARHVAQLETEMKREYSRAYIKYKGMNNPKTNRPYSDDLCKEKANISRDYKKAEDTFIEARGQESLIYACVRAFEGRQQMIQTISANTRKEV